MILALWVLGFLTVLALAIGLGARQKIMLLERIEDRSRVHLVAEAGAKKALAVLVDDLENSQLMLTVAAKLRRHNSPQEFTQVNLGDHSFTVYFLMDDERSGTPSERFGLADEQSKINLNTVNVQVLAVLLGDVLRLTTDDARRQAMAIIDWRDFGKHETEGFFSDDYYKSLEYPYEMKEQPFERLDELLLVKGMDIEKYNALLPYVTIWGDGKLNINTVPVRALTAIGLDPVVADKILKVRRGPDGVEATSDDHIFFRTFDIASEVKAVLALEEGEMRQIDEINKANILTTNSFYYSAFSRAVLPDGEPSGAEVFTVFDALANKVVYWYEK